MDVRAVFELPVYIWVMREALGATYPSGLGQLRFNVVMPADGSPSGGPPAVEGIESRPELSGDDIEWAHEYGAFIPESLQPATAVLRVGITNVDGPTYEHRAWCTPEHQLAECAHRWFDDVRTWVEIYTGQDLDPNHRVYDANAVGAGLTFIEPPHDSALGVQIEQSSVLPLRAPRVGAHPRTCPRRCRAAARGGAEPRRTRRPEAWRRSARDYRRCHRARDRTWATCPRPG